eukprot:TRINITY_DN7990_c0_g1_i4.p1 TRINITY_DN7990_c0_g1~~TRINITY_DN7990_c0_g1_i4.p1  ORF type:complete len:632 (+),score=84.17 TRINITY_DN7990_c0_g1_i4:658-2553(+)
MGLLPDSRPDPSRVVDFLVDVETAVVKRLKMQFNQRFRLVTSISQGIIYGAVLLSSTKTFDVFGPALKSALDQLHATGSYKISNVISKTLFTSLKGLLPYTATQIKDDLFTIDVRKKIELCVESFSSAPTLPGLTTYSASIEASESMESDFVRDFPPDSRTILGPSAGNLFPESQTTQDDAQVEHTAILTSDTTSLATDYHSPLLKRLHIHLHVGILFLFGIIEYSILRFYEISSIKTLGWVVYGRFGGLIPISFFLMLSHESHYAKLARVSRWNSFSSVTHIILGVSMVFILFKNEFILRSEFRHLINIYEVRFLIYDAYIWISLYATSSVASLRVLKFVSIAWFGYMVYIHYLLSQIIGEPGLPVFYILVYPAPVAICFGVLSLVKNKIRLEQDEAFFEHNVEMEKLKYERDYIEDLILSIIPRKVYSAAKSSDKTETRDIATASVLLIELYDFEQLCKGLTVSERIEIISNFSIFLYEFCKTMGLSVVKSIGTTFLVALNKDVKNSTSDFVLLVETSFQLHHHDLHARAPDIDSRLRFRTMISHGLAIGDIYGHQRFAYDLVGPAVQKAFVLLQRSAPERTQVSASVARKLSHMAAYTTEQMSDGVFLVGRNTSPWTMFRRYTPWLDE